MPPAALSTLYTDKSSVANLLGVTGLQLRLSDGGGRSGAVTGATNASPVVITSAVPHGLVTGDLVALSGVAGNAGANEDWLVTVLSSTTFSLDSSVGTGVYASGGTWTAIPFTEQAFLTNGCNVGTSWVNRYCQTLYESIDLANSWSVWNWATIKACHWFCARRGNPIPGSLLNLYLEAKDELEQVKAGVMPIEDIGMRNTCFPCWVNLRMDLRFSMKTMRVQRSISDRTPALFPEKVDLNDQILAPFEIDSL